MHRYPQPIAPLSQNQQMQCNHHGVTSRIAIDSAIVGKVCFTISEMRETSRFRTVNGWWSELASTLSRDGPYAQLARLSLYTDQERSSRYPCPWHLLLHRAIHESSRVRIDLHTIRPSCYSVLLFAFGISVFAQQCTASDRVSSIESDGNSANQHHVHHCT